MEPKTSDIRAELEARIKEAQDQLSVLKEERDKIDEKLRAIESEHNALLIVYHIEAKRLGKPTVPPFIRERIGRRFAGMKLTEALATLRKEQPQITKEQAHKILVKEGFDFRSDRTRSAVHFAWVALGRRKK